MFAQKLDFLMNVTNTLNSSLAQAVSVDASLISRLRRGERNLPKNAKFKIPMAEYFAKHLKEPFQKKTICDIFHLSDEWPSDIKVATNLIYSWLFDIKNTKDEISTFLSEISNPQKEPRIISSNNIPNYKEILSNFEKEIFYYGDDGKRKACLRLLSEVINREEPQTILVFSDENSSCFNRNTTFFNSWTCLLSEAIKKGTKVKLIHSVYKNDKEILQTLIKWLPLYMTGAVEPFYCPKIRDGIFQKTLIIAPNTGAVVSNSVNNDTSDMLTIYINNKEAINAVSIEFERYFNMCNPLTTIINANNSFNFLPDFTYFQTYNANAILISPIPSPMIIPEHVINRMKKECPMFLSLWDDCVNNLNNVSKKYKFTEILVPFINNNDDDLIIPMSDLLFTSTVKYTKAEYKEMINNAINIASSNHNYELLFSKSEMKDIIIYIKEGIGAIVAKASAPTTVFKFNEPNLIAALWSYLTDFSKKIRKDNKKNLLSTLKKYNFDDENLVNNANNLFNDSEDNKK